MFKYSHETIQKYPWLWKYDKRFRRGCRYQGHRYHWNQIMRLSGFYASLGHCIRCAKVCRVAVTYDRKTKAVKLSKVFEDPGEMIVLTPMEVKALKEFVRERAGRGEVGEAKTKSANNQKSKERKGRAGRGAGESGMEGEGICSESESTENPQLE